ncbi:type II toxin-antitoxin system HigA family antitoxin [Mariniphaga sp.]|uniref:helix-turn-helix domain-containing protein n=1 Tax=Mariniphaga sp. TaxID=1954475 RepID=UPI003563A58F
MKIKVLKTEKEYNEACKRVYSIINSKSELIEPESSEGQELELLSLLIEKYEQEHYKMDVPTPIEAIRFRMEQMNLKQIDIAPLLGGETRVSEVLNGKRALTLKMITLLNKYLGIPLESLIVGNKDIQLEEKKRQKLLRVSSIKDYLTSRAAIV